MASEKTTGAIARPGMALRLPAKTTHVRFGALTGLIADALWPDLGPDDLRLRWAGARINLSDELQRAVDGGSLRVLDPLTFGRHTSPHGQALQCAMVAVEDLREWLQDTRRMSVEIDGELIEPMSAPAIANAAKPSGMHSPPPGLTYWKHMLYLCIAEIDRTHPPRATAREAIAHLKRLNDPRLAPMPGHTPNILYWVNDQNDRKPVSAKTVGNALPLARRWAEQAGLITPG